MKEYSTHMLGDVCSRLSSGKGLSSKSITETGNYPVYGGNGLRGYTDTYNFDGDCAIIGRQGAFCGNVRYFQGKAYMTEHAVVACANSDNSTRYLSYLLSQMNLGRLSGQSAQPGLSVKTLAKQSVLLPSLAVQKKAALLLDSLDRKIEINTDINHHLVVSKGDNSPDIKRGNSVSRNSARRVDSSSLAFICKNIGATILSKYARVSSLGKTISNEFRMAVVMLGTAEPTFIPAKLRFRTIKYAYFATFARSICV